MHMWPRGAGADGRWVLDNGTMKSTLSLGHGDTEALATQEAPGRGLMETDREAQLKQPNYQLHRQKDD